MLSTFEDLDIRLDLKDLIRRHCERNNIPQLTAKNLYGVDRVLQFS